MRVDLGSHAIEYALSGAGQCVITLLHGLATTKETFAAVTPLLEADARVLRLDLRGHGGSGSPPGAWTLDDLVADVVRVLDALAIEDTVMVGHSGGAVTAMPFAMRHGDRVRSLVLAAAASQANERAGRWYEELAQKAERLGGASVLEDFGWSAGGPAPDGVGFAKAARCMATLWPTPLTPRLAEIRCPVTIVVGSDDFIGAGGSVIMHRHLPGSRLEILPGLGHHVHMEDPATFARIVRDAIR